MIPVEVYVRAQEGGEWSLLGVKVNCPDKINAICFQKLVEWNFHLKHKDSCKASGCADDQKGIFFKSFYKGGMNLASHPNKTLRDLRQYPGAFLFDCEIVSDLPLCHIHQHTVAGERHEDVGLISTPTKLGTKEEEKKEMEMEMEMEKKKDQISEDHWRYGAGLNMIVFCKNSSCLAHRTSSKGYLCVRLGYTVFNPTAEIYKCKCTLCGGPTALREALFLNCEWRYFGNVMYHKDDHIHDICSIWTSVSADESEKMGLRQFVDRYYYAHYFLEARTIQALSCVVCHQTLSALGKESVSFACGCPVHSECRTVWRKSSKRCPNCQNSFQDQKDFIWVDSE